MKYYIFTFPVSNIHPEYQKPYGLFRTDGKRLDKYVGLGRWITPEGENRILADIKGYGGGWANYTEVQESNLSEIKKVLFPETL